MPPKQLAKSMVTSLPPAGLRFYDIGANLLDSMFRGEYHGNVKHAPDFDSVLARAARAGVSHICVTAGSLSEARDALALCEQQRQKEVHPSLLSSAAVGDEEDAPSSHPRLFCTVGVHPTRVDEYDAYNRPSTDDTAAADDAAAVTEAGVGADAYQAALLDVARAGMRAGHTIAIGEAGLDYDRLQFASKAKQLEHFERAFALAEQTGLPLFLHNRNTNGDFERVVARNRHRFTRGVVHSFDGSLDELRALLALDLYIGVNGCSLRADDAADVVAAIPLNRLLLETDAPWCEIRPSHPTHAHLRSRWPTVANKKYDEARASATTEPAARDLCVKSRQEPCHIVQVAEAVAAVRRRRVGGGSGDEEKNVDTSTSEADRIADLQHMCAVIFQNSLDFFFPNDTAGTVATGVEVVDDSSAE